MNRVITGRLAALHFAATRWAADNLLGEGVTPESIEITGNTGIDAVLTIRDAIERGQCSGLSLECAKGKKLIVVTAHRRESFGEGFGRICQAVSALAGRDDVRLSGPFIRIQMFRTQSMQPFAAEQTSFCLSPWIIFLLSI